jgi:hypothetical protein
VFTYSFCDPRSILSAKKFDDSLASFALAPSTQTHPLTSKVIVLSKNGSLELHALHDTPKQVIWSARGDFTFGAGQTFKFFPGFHDAGTLAKPLDGVSGHETEQAQSHQPRGVSSIRSRGRSKPRKPSPAMFGRGDEDGFPALGAASTKVPDQALNDIATTKPGKLKTNHHHLHQHAGSEHSRSIDHFVEDDISMIMRRRALQGYGPNYVRLLFFRDKSSGQLRRL